jgi:hypothetical protein
MAHLTVFLTKLSVYYEINEFKVHAKFYTSIGYKVHT